MNISLSDYRVRVGLFNNRICKIKCSVRINLYYEIQLAIKLMIFSLLLSLLLLCGDIEINPGPSSSDTSVASTNSYNSNIDTSSFSHKMGSLISMMHLNIQSFKPKIDIINSELKDFDILCFTESWLHNAVSDNDLLLNGFDPPHRKDRTDRAGGGVLVFCKDFLCSKRRDDLEIHGLENIWIEINVKPEKYLIGTFYRPPNSSNDKWNLIEESIEKAIDTKTKNIIITGDFNENQLGENDTKIKILSNNFGLKQLISLPTSFSENTSTLIDLIITNNPEKILYRAVRQPFLDINVRYHCPVVALINAEKQKCTVIRRKIWLYNQGNYDLYRTKIQETDWDQIFENNNNIDKITKTITETILSIASETIPNRIITIRNHDLPWITNEIKKLMRKRDRIRRKAKRTNNQNLWNTFKTYRNKVIDNLRAAKLKYHENLCQKIKSNEFTNKDWWSLVKKVSNLSSKPNSINVLMNKNNELITDDIDKANHLNSYFASQSIIADNDKEIPSEGTNLPRHDCFIDDVIITPTDVSDALKLLNVNKASGPDQLSPILLKEAINELSIPLHRLYNLSLATKTFPSFWKIAHIVPVHKKEDPKIVTNYRPISLLCVISKIFEKCMYKYLYNYIIENNLLSRHQSGFRSGDSTVNQLLSIVNEFSNALDLGKEIRVIFFDISKAFDRVWHKGLLFKIQNLGITGNLFTWIKSYLSTRKQKVIINGKESSVLEINAGVPQGSILGPLFFIIFINDIVTNISCTIKLFADDTSIYIIIDQNNSHSASSELNSDLRLIHEWSNKWLVKFNPNKTESLLISRKTNQISYPTLYFDNTPVNEVSKHKHLGLTLNSTLHWGDHIDEIIAKANSKLNILRSLKYDLDRKTLTIMYFTFIRPMIEYCDIIIDNCPEYYKTKLEQVNIEAARIATGATRLVSIETLFSECGWDKLEIRREKHKLTQFFKIVNNLTPEYLTDLLPPNFDTIHNYNTRNSQNLPSQYCRTSYHLNSFFPSCICLWNNLPQNIKNSTSINSFKLSLDKHYNPSNIKIPKYYFDGSRRGQILHARLRMRCSSLKQHLFLRNIETDPFCSCGKVESNMHFLLECPKFHSQRTEFFHSLHYLPDCTTLLFGDETKSYEFNKQLFTNVQKYILKTKRFN